MLTWTKISVLLIVLTGLFSLIHCDDSQYRYNRIYRLRVPEEYIQVFAEALQNGEADGKYDILHMTRRSSDFTDVMVKRSSLRDFKKLIQEFNVEAFITDHDVERSIKLFKRANQRAAARTRVRRSTNTLPTHKMYISFHEMEAALKTFDRLYEHASLEEIGKTVENRSLWLLKISQDTSLPIVWIDAGIHAREWIAPATAFYLIDKLLSKDGCELLSKFQFYIAPNVNPDGYVFSHIRNRLWRKNRNKTEHENCLGVDLNRNFPYKWGLSGSSGNPCSDIYRGSSAADQVETQSIIKKLTAIAPQTKLFITLHSYGQLILIPFGYLPAKRPDNYNELKRISIKVIFKLWKHHNTVYSSGTAADILYSAAGGSDDFARGDLKIPYSYTIELPDLGSYNFLLPPSFIIPVGNQIWDALQTFVGQMK
ncbi:unnamed protein product [Hymenolepis diminuta]|uniref:Peptidase M14 domain-containing protein n=2 Tax=Hymenolepis diminuta TaxID=6216 RepID=A0A564YUX8_HYMDI|nr:unnamed protein product [Hymenolepis diminuta]